MAIYLRKVEAIIRLLYVVKQVYCLRSPQPILPELGTVYSVGLFDLPSSQ